MSKVSGYATMLAVALSLIAASCSGPVFFKPSAVSTAATNSSTPSQAAVPTTGLSKSVAAAGAETPSHGGPSAAKPVLADAPISGVPVPVVPPSPGDTIAMAPAATNPVAASAAPPAVAVEAVSPWNGAGVFGVFAVGLFVVIGLANFVFSGKPSKKR